MGILKRTLRSLVFGILAIVLLFEEWGWEPLASLFRRLARLPLWAQLERQITGLPRWSALPVFGAPMVALLPVKLLALYLFGQGYAMTGLVLLSGRRRCCGVRFCGLDFLLGRMCGAVCAISAIHRRGAGRNVTDQVNAPLDSRF